MTARNNSYRTAGVLMLLLMLCGTVLADRAALERGLEAYKQQDWTAAETQFREALETDPGNAEIHYNLGAVQFKQEKYEDALESLKKALLTNDVTLQQHTWYNTGNVHAKMEKHKEAIDAYKKALELDPDDVDAKYNLELVRARLKEQSEKQQQDQQQQQDQPKPSEYAKQLKAQAENLVSMQLYPEAYNLMSKGLERDNTVSAFQQFIDRIKTVVDIGTPE